MTALEQKRVESSASHAQVTAIWRYPVSSMAGERLVSADVGATGIKGDREWGVYDCAADRIAYPGREKRSLAVPRGHARVGKDGALEISTDGIVWGTPTSASSLAALSDLFGFPADVRPYQAANGFQPRYVRSPIHLLTTAAMQTLRQALPDSIIDERRFRPNLLVDVASGADPIPENSWIGREIRIGDVILRGSSPCGRCGFTTLEQDGLPLDVEVLRTIVKRFGRNFGIYCDVLSAGEIRLGDRIVLGGIVN